MMHGYGSNEEDLFSFAGELPDKYFIISVRAVYPLPPYGNAWYAINFDEEKGKWTDNEQAITSRDLIAKFITEATEKYDLDPNNINLLGFSQGAILSYAVALSYPQLVNKIIALSGYIHEPIYATDYAKNDLSKISIFASHGTVDNVIPLDWAQNTQFFIITKCRSSIQRIPCWAWCCTAEFL